MLLIPISNLSQATQAQIPSAFRARTTDKKPVHVSMFILTHYC